MGAEILKFFMDMGLTHPGSPVQARRVPECFVGSCVYVVSFLLLVVPCHPLSRVSSFGEVGGAQHDPHSKFLYRGHLAAWLPCHTKSRQEHPHPLSTLLLTLSPGPNEPAQALQDFKTSSPITCSLVPLHRDLRVSSPK